VSYLFASLIISLLCHCSNRKKPQQPLFLIHFIKSNGTFLFINSDAGLIEGEFEFFIKNPDKILTEKKRKKLFTRNI
jgi:hypothetical protein